MSSLSVISDCPHYWRMLSELAGHRIFDVGANGGGTARLFAPYFDSVVAFEPAAESYDDLVNNLPSNVVAQNMAISDHTGLVTLREASNALRSGQLVSDGPALDWGDTIGHRDVICMSLDDATLEWGHPDVVKVDVEGHELHVLSGATHLIEGKQTKWYLEVHSAGFERPIRESFSGYKVETHRHSGYPEDSDGWREHFYLIAIP